MLSLMRAGEDCSWRNLWREPFNRSPKEQTLFGVKLSGKRTEEWKVTIIYRCGFFTTGLL
jgi:hypothetical protein